MASYSDSYSASVCMVFDFSTWQSNTYLLFHLIQLWQCGAKNTIFVPIYLYTKCILLVDVHQRSKVTLQFFVHVTSIPFMLCTVFIPCFFLAPCEYLVKNAPHSAVFSSFVTYGLAQIFFSVLSSQMLLTSSCKKPSFTPQCNNRWNK